MSSLTGLLTGLSTSIGVSLLANLSYDRIRQFLSARTEAQKLAGDLESAALQSNDISRLGSYLYEISVLRESVTMFVTTPSVKG